MVRQRRRLQPRPVFSAIALASMLVALSGWWHLPAKAEKRDERVLQGLFRSIEGKAIRDQRRILRDIVLMNDSRSLKYFAAIMLNPDRPEPVRREAAKAIVHQRSSNEGLKRLLQMSPISMEATLEAVELSPADYFRVPLLRLMVHPKSDRKRRRLAMLLVLRQWDPELCDEEMGRFVAEQAASPEIDPLINHLDAYRKESTPERLDDPLKMRSALLLWCLDDQSTRSELSTRYHEFTSSARYQFVRFLGRNPSPEAYTILKKIILNDKVQLNRLAAIEALAQYNDKKSLKVLAALYPRVQPIEVKQHIVDFLAELSGGRAVLKKLVAKEKDKKMKQYLRAVLAGHPAQHSSESLLTPAR